MDGFPEFPASLIDITSIFNLKFNQMLIVLPIVSSTKASFNIPQVSVASLPSFKQTLMPTCSFKSVIFWWAQHRTSLHKVLLQIKFKVHL
jgi:hypothetical protein